MSYRGSFSKCVSAMAVLFGQGRYDFLHIVHCPHGKYYTLYTPQELDKKNDGTGTAELRIVCSITRKEMSLLYDRSQQDLFPAKAGEQTNSLQD